MIVIYSYKEVNGKVYEKVKLIIVSVYFSGD